MNVIIDVALVVSATLAVWLTQQQNKKLQKYACLVGLAGQPLWLYVTWQLDQVGMFICAILYTLIWCIGAWHHWLAPVRFHIHKKGHSDKWSQEAEDCETGLTDLSEAELIRRKDLIERNSQLLADSLNANMALEAQRIKISSLQKRLAQQ